MFINCAFFFIKEALQYTVDCLAICNSANYCLQHFKFRPGVI